MDIASGDSMRKSQFDSIAKQPEWETRNPN